MEIKVLFEGKHDNHYFEDGSGYDIFPLYSSSILIKGKKNVLVDTGDALSKDRLIEALGKENLSPLDIDFLIITHFHLDHTANNYLFENARIVAHNAVRFPDGRARIFRKLPEDLISGVEIFNTPGHTMDSISVKIGDTICAGDAIRPEFILNKKVPKYRSGDLYLESLKKIFSINAKRIIPGHGGIIEGEKLLEFKEIVDNLSIENVY